jgi:hypothetical protein
MKPELSKNVMPGGMVDKKLGVVDEKQVRGSFGLHCCGYVDGKRGGGAS